MSIGRPDRTFSGQAVVGGWAVDDSASVTSVAVTIDGVVWGNATYGIARPDVCAAYPGRAGCPNVGWGFILDTTMLADGSHILAATANGSDGRHLTGQAEFAVNNGGGNGAVHLVMENPGPQSSALIGGTTVKGFAFDTASAISGVSVYLDGILAGTATYGISRPDACADVQARGCPDVGWSFVLDTTKVADGSHALEILATAADGSRASTSIPVQVSNWSAADPIRIGIGSPSVQNSSLSGSTLVGGWAIDDLTSIATVAISIDGKFVGDAAYGISRPDVCSAYPNRAGCPNVGWGLFVDTTALADGTHTLAVTAMSSSGESSTAARSFTVANLARSSPFHISIEAPVPDTPLTGVSGFGGWAIDTAAPITQVTVSVDGVLLGNAGRWARPDACAAYGNPAGCPNAGWSFYLDTTTLANGMHELSVTAMAASGARATAGTMFDVEN